MSTARLWAISGSAVLAVAVIVTVVVLTVGPSESSATPTPTASASATQSPDLTAPSATPYATPVSTPSPTPEIFDPRTATCEDVLTSDYLAQVASNGWQVWDTAGQKVGADPFGGFPNGRPDVELVCRAGKSPDAATDNVQDHAWARVDPESAVAAMQQLEAAGYTRTDGTDGVYLSKKASPGYGDADGWGESYKFTQIDVRWAYTRADLSAIRPLSEIG